MSTEDRVWGLIAPALAGRQRVRVSRDRGKNYPARCEQSLVERRPAAPAAVMVYSLAGMASTIFLDLDTSRGGIGSVARDAEEIRQWLGRHGAHWVEDISPNGGRHFYVPLVNEVPFHEARDFVEALAVRFTTVDPAPHRSVASGCCRVPGSTHKTGGIQQLTQALGEAVLAVSERNSPNTWTALWEDTAGLRAARALEVFEPEEDTVLDPDQTAGLSARVLRIAREGIYDHARYPTPSEARMAVITGATRAGMTVADIQQKMLTGAWPALAGLYAKYSPSSRAKTLTREWRKAVALVAASPREEGSSGAQRSVRKSDTSIFKSQGGTPQPEPSRSENVVFLAAWSAARKTTELNLQGLRKGLGLRMMLRALEESSSKKGTREFSFGVRALSSATGIHPSTAAAQLQTLAAMDEALIRKISPAKGREADSYELVLPQQPPHSPAPRQRVHAVRPAFRELGLPAAFVYETLENTEQPLNVPEIAQATGISKSTVHEALETLASWGLAKRNPDGWKLGTASLKTCAELLGVIETVMQQQALYRRQRTIWHAWLDNRQQPATIPLPDEPYPYWLFEPPEDPGSPTPHRDPDQMTVMANAA
jgi:predicted DNA-binding transcriptional regulator AlpA